LSLTAVPNASGSVTVTVNVTDGTDTVSDVFMVILESVNDAPVMVAEIDSQSMSEDTTKNIDISGVFSDVDGDELTIVASSSDTAIFSVEQSGNTIVITPVSNVSGVASVILTATDSSNAEKEHTFTVTVNAVNDAPHFISSTNYVITVNYGVAIGSFEIHDVEGDAIIYSMGTANDSSLFTIDEEVGEIRSLSTIKDQGSYFIEIKATDGSDYTSTSLIVDVVKDTRCFAHDFENVGMAISELLGGETLLVPCDIESNSVELALSNKSMDVAGEARLNDTSITLESASFSAEKIILSNSTMSMSNNSELLTDILESVEDATLILDETSVVNVANIVNPGKTMTFQNGTVKSQQVTGNLIFNNESRIFPIDCSKTLVVDGDVSMQDSTLYTYLNVNKASFKSTNFNISSSKLIVRISDLACDASEFNWSDFYDEPSNNRSKLITSFNSGDTYDVLDFENISGEFDTIELPTLPEGLEWDIRNLYISGEISVVSSVSDRDVQIVDSQVLAYPNPFRISRDDSFELGFEINKDVDLEVHVYNMLTQLVVEKTVSVERDVYTRITIDKSEFSSINAGVYLYFILYNGKVIEKGRLGILP
jgi:hypothetical protein